MKYIEPWQPYPLEVTLSDKQRSPERLAAVIEQFRLPENPRYTPRALSKDGTQATFCNIFLWDFTRAMSCEIPHWAWANGAPAPVGRGKELNANQIVAWLGQYGHHYGWRKLTEEEARGAAVQGYPCVVVWQHHGGIGHVAAVRGGSDGITHIAQAGSSNFERGALSRGFGRLKAPALEFWMHL